MSDRATAVFLAPLALLLLVATTGSGEFDCGSAPSDAESDALSAAPDAAEPNLPDGPGPDDTPPPLPVDVGPPPPSGACGAFTLAVSGDCGDQPEFISAPAWRSGDDPIVHVIGIYEGPSDHSFGDHPTGTVSLTVGPTRAPVILALSSYEPVEWAIDADPEARIERILLYGYYESLVSGVDGVPVEVADGRGSVHCWPPCNDAAEAFRLADDIRTRTGLEVASFQGCYQAEALSMAHVCRPECAAEVACDGRECGPAADCGWACGACDAGEACFDGVCEACTPDCDGRACGDDGCGGSCGTCAGGERCDARGRCQAVDVLAGCEAVAREPYYCMTLVGGEPAVIGLATGTVCRLPAGAGYRVFPGHETNSIAWQTEFVYGCNSALGPGLARVSTVDGHAEHANIPCGGVASWRGGLLVRGSSMPRTGPFTFYEDFDAALAGAGTPVTVEGNPDARFTVGGDTLYTAWHSTDRLETFDLETGLPIGEVFVEGYDTWVQGLSVTDDGLLVLNATWPESRLAVFDAATGGALWSVDVRRTAIGSGPGTSGLVCVANHGASACDDGDPCTWEYADPDGGACDYEPRPCNDRSLCTTDSCDPASGACVFMPVDCDDGDPCTEDGCDPETGCWHGPPCDDGDPCTDDACDAASGTCRHTPSPDPDGDGTPNCRDDCPADAAKTAPGDCGCGNADVDENGNGWSDCLDYACEARSFGAPGTYTLKLVADCAVTARAWGAGGGGGGSATGDDSGGGGGGGASAVLRDGGVVLVGGGGGGGGAGKGSGTGGGGGGGGLGERILGLQTGDVLTIVVGGGGQPGCDDVSGDGGGPEGGAGSVCSGGDASFGGGGGRVCGCGSPGTSLYGGGGGGTGTSVWGGGGGGDPGAGCDGASTHGAPGGCGAGLHGGGGGGGGGLGDDARIGATGEPGSTGGAGAPSPDFGAGGAGSPGCSGAAGDSGRVELAPSDDGPAAATCVLDMPCDDGDPCTVEDRCGPSGCAGRATSCGSRDCVDADGDGWPACVDCDDGDILVNPGAAELADNGVDDDCRDGDLTAAAGDGIYVAPGGDDGAAGTMDTPLATLTEAARIAEQSGKAIFVAGGDYSSDFLTGLRTGASLFGGYEAVGWTRDLEANVTTLHRNAHERAAIELCFDGVGALSGVAIAGGGGSPDNWNIRVACGRATVADTLSYEGSAGESFYHLFVDGGAHATVARCRLGGGGGGYETVGVQVEAGGDALIVDSVITGGLPNGIGVRSFGGRVRMLGTVVGDRSWHGLQTGVDLALSPGSRVVNSTILAAGHAVARADGVAFVNDVLVGRVPLEAPVWHGRTELVHCLVWSPAGGALATGAATIDDVDACDWTGCGRAWGNVTGDPLFLDPDAGDVHLQPGSPAIDQGTDPASFGLPVPRDIDGDSRPQGAAFDIGADEFVPAP